MIKNIYMPIIYFSLLCLISCHTIELVELEDKLEGLWLIDSIMVNNVDIQSQYRHNGIMIRRFGDDNRLLKCPPQKSNEYYLSPMYQYNEGEWKVYFENNKTFFISNIKDTIFQDTFELSLNQLSDTIEIMSLKSKTVEIKCRKESRGY